MRGHRSRRRNRCFFLFSFQHVEAHLSFLQNLLALGLLQLVSGLRLSWETPRCRLQTESAFLDQIDFVFDRLEVVLALALLAHPALVKSCRLQHLLQVRGDLHRVSLCAHFRSARE